MRVVSGTEHYIVDEPTYEGDKDMLSPKPVGQTNGMILYSNKHKEGSDTQEVTKGTGGEPVVFHQFLSIEMYDENVQEYGDKLNGAPTGIYGGDRIVQFEDAKGKKVNWYIERTSELGCIEDQHLMHIQQ